MNSTPIVITGPPGAGKSTVAGLLAGAADRSVLVEGDAFFGFLAEGAIEPWLPASRAQNETVTEAAAAATGRFARAGYVTVFDGVVGPWMIDRFLAAAGLDVIDYVILLPPVERCLDRVANRVGHGFRDPTATSKMHEEFVAADIDQWHVLANSDDSAAITAQRIRSVAADGRFRYQLNDG